MPILLISVTNDHCLLLAQGRSLRRGRRAAPSPPLGAVPSAHVPRRGWQVRGPTAAAPQASPGVPLRPAQSLVKGTLRPAYASLVLAAGEASAPVLLFSCNVGPGPEAEPQARVSPGLLHAGT